MIATVMVRAFAVAGLAALGASGSVKTALAGFAGIFFAWAFSLQLPPRWLNAVALVTLALALGLPIAVGLPWAASGAGLLTVLAILHAAGDHAPERRRTLLFSVLMTLLASTVDRSPALGPILLLEAALLPMTLLVVHLDELPGAARRAPYGAQGRRWAWVGLGLFSVLSSAAWFLVLPRVRAGVGARESEGQDLSGFSPTVALGDVAEIKESDAVVLRLKVQDEAGITRGGPFYLRGVALDHFDGVNWTASQPAGRFSPSLPLEAAPAAMSGLLRQEILLEPFESVPLFALDGVRAVYAQEPLSRDEAGGARFGAEARRRAVVAFSTGNPEGGGPEGKLQLPDGLDPRIAALALEVGGGGPPAAVAAELSQYLELNYAYTLLPPTVPSDRSPLSAFLFDERRGHCEYFATALAVMLRTQGVPSRVVNGFYGGEPNEVGDYLVVREAHAHSWVEAWIDGAWTRLDATPTGTAGEDDPGWLAQAQDALIDRWHRTILGYDLQTQLEAAAALGAMVGSPDELEVPVGAVIVIVVLGGSLLLLPRLWRVKRPRPEPGGASARALRKARALARSRGWLIPEPLPPLEAARWLRAQAGEEAAPLEALAWQHYGVRYGGQAEDAEAAARHLRALEALPRRPGA